MESGRKQTIFVGYSEEALYCVNRDISDTEPFLDKSWYPWATYEDMKFGNKIEAQRFGGKDIYWKFISDVAYLQAPYEGRILIRDDPNTTSKCEANDLEYIQCKTYDDPPGCSDPMKRGPEHEMWHETKYHTLYQCSLHESWNRPFLDASDPESWPENRKSTFITFETTEVTIAAFVVSPRIDALPDMQSLVRVKFLVDASGFIEVEKSVMTTSDT